MADYNAEFMVRLRFPAPFVTAWFNGAPLGGSRKVEMRVQEADNSLLASKRPQSAIKKPV